MAFVGPRRALLGQKFNPAALALFAEMTVPPTPARKILINNTITALIVGGVWAIQDVFYITAAHDAQAARLNWKNPGTFTLSPQNSPTFLADRGYTGDGATSYLNSSFVTGVNGIFAQDNNHLGEWVGTNVDSATMRDIGTFRNTIDSRSTTNTLIRCSAATSDTVAGITTSIGFTLMSRNVSTGYDAYKNGVLLAAVTRTSGALSADALFMCAANNGGSTSQPSTRRIQAMTAGGYLNATQHLALYNATATYMTAVGA